MLTQEDREEVARIALEMCMWAIVSLFNTDTTGGSASSENEKPNALPDVDDRLYRDEQAQAEMAARTAAAQGR